MAVSQVCAHRVLDRDHHNPSASPQADCGVSKAPPMIGEPVAKPFRGLGLTPPPCNLPVFSRAWRNG